MSNVIVLDSSDEEDPPPPKKIKTYSIPSKQKLQILNQRQNVPQQQQHQQQQQPFKKMQNSIQITPIYNNNNNNNNLNNNNNNNNNNNSIKNNQNINKILKNQLEKMNNTTTINTIGDVTINKTPMKIINSISSPLHKTQINNNNINKIRTTTTSPISTINSTINELNSLKTININKNLLNNSTTTTISLPNSIKNTITVKRINSPVAKLNNHSSPTTTTPSATPTTGITIKSINTLKQQQPQQQLQQHKKELIDPLKLPEINQLQKITINNNNNNKDHVNKLPIKWKLSEKTNFEKNLEQQIAQRQQKPPQPPPTTTTTITITSPQSIPIQSPQRKRIKPITISNKINNQNWLNNNNNQSPIITIDDDDDNDMEFNSKPFSVKLNNSYIQNISSPIDTIKQSTINSTNTTKSIPHTITSPMAISTVNNDEINKNLNLPLPLTSSSGSTTPNSKQNGADDDDDENDVIVKNPITPIYEELLKVCRDADPSNDMELLIDKKLLKYYHSVHPDFVQSKGFRKTIESTISEIKTTPDLVYLKLKTIVEELKTRRKTKQSICNNEEHTTTGDTRKDDLVRKLNRGLYKLQMIIKKLEEDDVDFENDSNSPYLKAERYKKRACEIYEKICDLTGESKHAHRLVSKPISFQGTSYPPFNKTIQTFVNRTKSFPDYLDIYRLLEFCNKQNSWEMSPEEMKMIAQDAFIKIGKLLQKRRQTDLYETVMHFTGSNMDPAENDIELNAKLLENQKHITKISTVLEKFSKQQDFEAAERQKAKDDKKENSEENTDDDDNESREKCDNVNKENEIVKLNELEKTTSTTTGTTTTTTIPTIPSSVSDENTNRINSLQNPQPSTSKCSSQIKIHSVQSLRNNNNNNNNNLNHNIVGEIILSDDDEDDET